MPDPATPPPLTEAEQALREAEAAARDDKRQAALDGLDSGTEIVGAILDGTVGAVADGAVAVAQGAAAVAEGAVNVIGGLLGGLADL